MWIKQNIFETFYNYEGTEQLQNFSASVHTE